MSVVKFHCPNGHTLTAPENLAGKGGKCPKCQAPFVIPAKTPEEPPSVASGSDSAKQTAGGSSPQLNINLGSGIKEGASGSKPSNDIFVFLCPNGHKLNGPPSLKGKLGQCPHCGAKFHIPEDEPEHEEESEQEEYEENEFEEELLEPEAGEHVEELLHDELEIEEPEPQFEEGVHPLAHIVNRLWYHMGESGEMELLLPEGEIMQPEHYSPPLSSKEYGVFATREGRGYSFTVIPWANVRRVNVHKAEQLPPSAFTE